MKGFDKYAFFFRLKNMTTNYQALTPARRDIGNFTISTSHNNPAKEQVSNSSWLPYIPSKIAEDLENFCFCEFHLSIFTMYVFTILEVKTEEFEKHKTHIFHGQYHIYVGSESTCERMRVERQILSFWVFFLAVPYGLWHLQFLYQGLNLGL